MRGMFKHIRTLNPIGCLFCVALLLAPISASGDTALDDDAADDAQEQYDAREALKQGKIRPLEEIIEAVRKEIAGEIIEIEFEMEDGRYIYELEIIQASGQIIEIEVDALTKAIIGREGN